MRLKFNKSIWDIWLKNVLFGNINKENKIWMGEICFVYDINFQYSLKYIKDNNILNNKLDLIKKHSKRCKFNRSKGYYKFIFKR